MRRFFIDKEISTNDRISLTGEEARHILTVLRMTKGDKLILINGSGREMTAVITDTDQRSVSVEVIGDALCAAEPVNRITLFQCMPKAGKMELIIQKCVELGIYAVQPVFSSRCVVKPERSDNKVVRYNRVSHEAAKQCGRAYAPAVLDPLPLKKCDFSALDLVLVAYEDEKDTSIKSVLRSITSDRAPMDIAIVIGPEGGLEQSEVNTILECGHASAVSLGSRILRTETAGMAMLAMIMYELEG